MKCSLSLCYEPPPLNIIPKVILCVVYLCILDIFRRRLFVLLGGGHRLFSSAAVSEGKQVGPKHKLAWKKKNNNNKKLPFCPCAGGGRRNESQRGRGQGCGVCAERGVKRRQRRRLAQPHGGIARTPITCQISNFVLLFFTRHAQTHNALPL